MINFEYLNKSELTIFKQTIFDILADNMILIAPTGNSREEDFNLWSDAISESLQRTEREIILIRDDSDIVGYFQYSVENKTFKMEEIQFKPEYKGKGIFRKLYGFVLDNIGDDFKFVEAYASVNNNKSIAILEKLGLSNVGLNKNGRSYRFIGKFNDLIKWYKN